MSTTKSSFVQVRLMTEGVKGAGMKIGIFATAALADAAIAEVKKDGTFGGESISGKTFKKAEWMPETPCSTLEEWRESLEEGGSSIEEHNANIQKQIEQVKALEGKLPKDQIAGLLASLNAALKRPRQKKVKAEAETKTA